MQPNRNMYESLHNTLPHPSCPFNNIVRDIINHFRENQEDNCSSIVRYGIEFRNKTCL